MEGSSLCGGKLICRKLQVNLVQRSCRQQVNLAQLACAPATCCSRLAANRVAVCVPLLNKYLVLTRILSREADQLAGAFCRTNLQLEQQRDGFCTGNPRVSRALPVLYPPQPVPTNPWVNYCGYVRVFCGYGSKHGYTQITQRTKTDSINNVRPGHWAVDFVVPAALWRRRCCTCSCVVTGPSSSMHLQLRRHWALVIDALAIAVSSLHLQLRHRGVIVDAAAWHTRFCTRSCCRHCALIVDALSIAASSLHLQLRHRGVIIDAPAAAASSSMHLQLRRHQRCPRRCGVIVLLMHLRRRGFIVVPRNHGVVVDAPGPRRHIETAAVAAARQDGDVVAIDGGGCPNKLERHLVNQTTFEEETTTLNTSLSPCAAFGFSARVSASLGCHFTARMASCGSPTGTTKPPSDSARTPNVRHVELLILAGAKYAGAGMGIRDALQLLQVLWMSVLVVLGLTRRRQSLVVVVQQMGVTEKEER
ncbi:hypothetical protein BDZ97DRAFT_1769094 [Flammula alnicola]|nr:hypothetical protein BDZ97DRAFT_1769094 [Flammula alnicola]